MNNLSSFLNCLFITILLVTYVNAQSPNFCWRDTIARGVGTTPNVCGANQEIIGLFCYDKCPQGYSRVGFDCHQNCPVSSEWKDIGQYCLKIEYSRGEGYGWKLGDPLSISGQLLRCYLDKPVNGCESFGTRIYPKCKTGYYAFECCMCKPQAVNCKGLGYNEGSGPACLKKIKIGVPTYPGCPAGHENSGGFCYPACPVSPVRFIGVGPVCWRIVLSGWVQCGMAGARYSNYCTSQSFNQVTTVGSLIINITTLATVVQGTKATIEGIQSTTGVLAKIQPQIAKLKELYNTVDNNAAKFREILSKLDQIDSKTATVSTITKTLLGDVSNISEADALKLAASIASLFGPVGIQALITTYSFRYCSKVKF